MVAASETAQSLVPAPKKRRTQAQKVGRLQYILDLEQRILKELELLRITQRYMIQGLDIGGYLHFDKPYIEKVCCREDVDKAILNELHCAGAADILLKDLAKALEEYELDRWQVLRRIQRMNQRLDQEIAQEVAEKQGHKWALTNFAREAWGQTKEESSLSS
jgi:hypothetical protein